MMQHARSLIVALDVPTARDCAEVACAVQDVPLIGGFKVGFEAGLEGLARVVWAVRQSYHLGPTKIIYDHQKAGNDIPEMGKKFAQKIKNAGCDAVILFPFAGPETQARWTEACQEAQLDVLIGGVMTHDKFLVSEGGYVSDDASEKIFRLACRQGVYRFVVPGTKVDWVKRLRAMLDAELGASCFDLYAPGFITQGGDISECGKAAGERFHPIVGSAIYNQKTQAAMREVALQITSKL